MHRKTHAWTFRTSSTVRGRASELFLERCMLCSFCLLICQSTRHVLASLSPPPHTGDTVVTQSNTCALYLGRSLKIDDDACFIHNHCVLDQVISLSRLQHMHAHTHTHTHTHTTQKYTHAHATNHTRSHTNTHKQTHTHTCIIYTYHVGHIWWIRRALFAFTCVTEINWRTCATKVVDIHLPYWFFLADT